MLGHRACSRLLDMLVTLSLNFQCSSDALKQQESRVFDDVLDELGRSSSKVKYSYVSVEHTLARSGFTNTSTRS